MSTTLTYGFKLPQDGDRGSTWFPDLAFDIQRLNDHSHDGQNSAPINSISIASTTQNILAASWVATSDGIYRQLITVPNGKLYDNSVIIFRNTATKSQMFLGVEKVSATTYYAYINDNTVNVTAYYVS
jgi:hypothetical protein